MNKYYELHVEYTYKTGDVKSETFKISDKQTAESVFEDNKKTLQNCKTNGDVRNFSISLTEKSFSLISMISE